MTARSIQLSDIERDLLLTSLQHFHDAMAIAVGTQPPPARALRFAESFTSRRIVELRERLTAIDRPVNKP